MLEVRLPKFLEPRVAGTLVRLGRKNDGGYVVEQSSIRDADALIGLGLDDDWSFEEDFTSLNDVPVWAFDPTVGRGVFAKRAVKALLRPYRRGRVAHHLRVFNGYNRFFTGRRVHHEKYVGPTTGDNVISFRDIINNVVGSERQRIFLKMDIEGAEFRILNQILAASDRLTGLVVEFHDVDWHLDRIKAFVEALPLRLCHVHCNNYGAITEDGTPTAIECSFTRHEATGSLTWGLPHPLDMPCRPDQADYRIVFY